MAKNQKKTKSASIKQTKPRKAKQTKRIKHPQSKKSTGRKETQSNYNLYMKQALSQIKADNPNLTHQEAFKKAAQQWSTSSENPKNQ